jgi:hypothetical protein
LNTLRPELPTTRSIGKSKRFVVGIALATHPIQTGLHPPYAATSNPAPDFAKRMLDRFADAARSEPALGAFESFGWR